MVAPPELLALHPAALVLLAALAAPVLSRRAGHAAGILATGYALAWSLLAPAGSAWHVAPLGFEMVVITLDEASRLMGVIFGLIGVAAVLYAYSSEAKGVTTGYALSYVASSLGAVLAGDWLTLLFCWELMAVTSTLLVWEHGGRAVRAGFRYALVHGIGGSLLMAGVVWHYVAVGSFRFGAADGVVPGVPALLVALGIGVNVGFVGLHAWLPDTYPRPHVAASVFLSVYTTKTGVYALFRAFPEGSLWIAYMGGAMAVVGVTYALLQHDMRRLLSYHIQSQVGYMVAGIGIGSTLATGGAMAHVYNHILYKALLFMTVGVLIYRTGEENLKHLGGGLWRQLPVTAAAFGIAALSISGFPGFNGFVSKGMVVGAAHKQHLDALWLLLLAAGVGTFMSFIKLGYYAFLRGSYDGTVMGANRGQRIAMLSVAGLCVTYGLAPEFLFALLPGTGAASYHPFTLGHVGEGLALAAIAIVGFIVVKGPLSRVGRVPDVDALYNPLAFYGTRSAVRAVTDAYAALDRVAVATVAGATRLLFEPGAVLSARRFESESTGSESEPGARTVLKRSVGGDVGVGVALVTATLTLLLLVLLW